MFLSEAPFEAFGVSHVVVVSFLLFLGSALLVWVKKCPGKQHLVLRWVLAMLLVYSAFSEMVNILVRYGFGNEKAWEMMHGDGYPLFLCDVVAILLAIALVLRSQRLTEVGYVWALAGTAHGLITPVLYYDWPSMEFLFFFIQHGFGPIAAILLVWGFGLKPEKGAYKRVWFWTWGYLLVVMSFNFVAETNYGFLNGKPEIATAFDYLGSYPWYLLSLQGIAAVLYALLLLPFGLRTGGGVPAENK